MARNELNEMTPPIEEIFFETRKALFEHLCSRITKKLRVWINQGESCGLVLPGGQTPLPLYEQLTEADLDWSSVHLSLSDERRVAPSSEQSNEYYLRETLLNKIPSTVRFQSLGMCHDGRAIESKDLAKLIDSWRHYKVISVLGMGNDGHIASLFPDCELSTQALHTSETENGLDLLFTHAPQEPKRRISMSLKRLLSCSERIVLITGEDKKQIYLKAKNSVKASAYYSLPIAHYLRARQNADDSAIKIYWAP